MRKSEKLEKRVGTYVRVVGTIDYETGRLRFLVLSRPGCGVETACRIPAH